MRWSFRLDLLPFLRPKQNRGEKHLIWKRICSRVKCFIGTDAEFMMKNLANKEELGIKSNVVRVHEAVTRKGRYWSRGQKVKILKGAYPGCHKCNIYATVEYFLLENLLGDAGGKARVICRPRLVPVQDGAKLIDETDGAGTALADLIDNSLEAVWSNREGERKLISIEINDDRDSVFDTGPGMDGSAENSVAKWGKIGASLHRSSKKQAISGKPPFLRNMWDSTPDTDLLSELPDDYSFETALTDLIVSVLKDNSLEAVWSNCEGERKLISIEINDDRDSVFDTGPGMDGSAEENSVAGSSSIEVLSLKQCKALDISNFYMLRGVFYKNPTSNLSNAYGAAMNRSIRFISTGVPSHTPSLSEQTRPEMWNCPVTRQVVQRFKSAVIYDEYVVLPGVAMPDREIIHIDSRIYKRDFCQCGMVSRSPEGIVLWSTLSKFRINLLVPQRWAMPLDKPDVNLAELSALGYLAIRVGEMGMSGSQLVLNDNKLSHIYMGLKDNDITKKSHKYLALLTKKVWFHCGLRRLVWVPNSRNQAADGLSRAITVSANDKEMKKYYDAVEREVENFNESIEKENAKKDGGGVDVEKGDDFEKELREFMKVYR